MTITTREQGPVTIMELGGKIMEETDTAELLKTVKQSMLAQRNLIVMDLEAVDWINSTGLGILIASYNLLREVGGKLVLTGLNRTVQQVMAMSKLNLVFDIQDNAVDAARRLAEKAKA
jgi:anti-sigma B factor antagonist